MAAMTRVAMSLLLVFLILFAPHTAAAGLVAKIHLSEQNISVFVDGERRYAWPISSGREGYETPTGEYRPKRVYERYYSRQYNNAPMPHSVFFYRGYAIHGTTAVARLGRRASRGCVRLHPDAAKTFYGLVRRYGFEDTKIVVAE